MKNAGWYAIASGVAGIVAYAFLIGYLVVRNQNMQTGLVIVRLHDIGVIIQFLCFIPVAFTLYKLIQQRNHNLTQTTLNIGIGALCFTALFLLLDFPKILADVLYMFPQGVFGVWLMVVCWRMKQIFPQWFKWSGIIVGFGLALVGIFPLGYAVFVDKSILNIPAASEEEVAKIPADTTANIILHKIVLIGSFMGVLTLPVWTIFLGNALLQKKASLLNLR